MFSTSFQWNYLFLGVLCIQVAYGLDNLSDTASDAKQWKRKVAVKKDTLLWNVYGLSLVGCFIVGLILATLQHERILPLIFLSGLVLIYHRSVFNKKGIGSIFKPFVVALSWFILLFGVPLFFDQTHDAGIKTVTFIQGLLILVPALLTAVMLSDYRDMHQEVLYFPSQVSLKHYLLASFICQMFMAIVGYLLWGKVGEVLFVTVLMNSGVGLLWSQIKGNIWGDVLIDSLGGTQLLFIWMLFGNFY